MHYVKHEYDLLLKTWLLMAAVRNQSSEAEDKWLLTLL